MPTVFPLNIPDKVNSPELLAFLQQFGIEKYLSAEEINQIKNALNLLYNSIGGGSGVTNNTGFNPSGENYIFNELFGWKFNGVDYSLPNDLTIPVPFALNGYHRIDLIVAENDTLIRIPGPEVLINVSPAEPTYNAITQLRITAIPVNDDSFGTVEPPSSPNIFVKKQFASVTEYSGSGTNKIIPFHPLGYSEVRLTHNGLISVSGFDNSLFAGNPNAELPYSGKPFVIWNISDVNILLKHADFENADYPLFLSNETDMALPPNKAALFHYDAGGLQEISFKNWCEIIDVIGLQSVLDLKADKTYVESLVVGLWDDRGAYIVNASGNINYPSSGGSGTSGALLKGDIFTVAGAVVGTSTINSIPVNNGDTIRALIDGPSSTNNAHWTIAENNIGYVPLSSNESSYSSASTPLNSTDKILIGQGAGFKTTSLNDVKSKILSGEIQLPAYPSSRNDGANPNNKVLNVDASGNLKLYSMSVMPPPYLEELIPDSYLPSTTGNFIIKGSFFTPTTTVTVEGQTLNYITFVSDNEMLVNLTTGATEGTFDVTINNGTSVVFENALLVILGDVFTPTDSDYTVLSGNVDTSVDGEIKVEIENIAGAVEFYNIPNGQDFRVNFRIAKSPINSLEGTGLNSTKIQLCQSGTVLFSCSSYINYISTDNFYFFVQESSTGIGYGNPATNVTDLIGKLFTYERIGTTFRFKVNNVTVKTFTDTVPSGDLQIRIATQFLDIVNIKYIELL